MPPRRTFALFAGAVLTTLSTAPTAPAADNASLPRVGRSEKVWIRNADAIVTARIDSGTRTSSLGVDSMTYLHDNGAVQVRFTFRDAAGTPHTVTRPIARTGTFKNSGLGTDERPVVTLGLCIGSIYRVTQVNLVSRKKFNYAMLIGRRFLSNRALVDTSKRLTVEPACRAAHPPPKSARSPK